MKLYIDLMDTQKNGSFSWQRYAGLLSSYRLEKLYRLQEDEDKNSSAAAELMLRCSVKRAGSTMGAYQPKAGGKPAFLTGENHFSLAHSQGAAAAALWDQPIGLDIEFQRAVRPGLGERIACERELSSHSVIALWCAKESYLKLTGEGLSRSMKGLLLSEQNTLLDAKTGKRLCGLCRGQLDSLEWSVAFSGQPPEIDLKIWTEQELAGFLL